MEIYIIRHPKVEEYHTVCYGHSDMAISDDALMAAVARVKETVPEYSELTYFSSDLTRCRLLAEKLSSGEVTYSSEIRELNFGDWEMKHWEEIPEEEVNYWTEDYVNRNCTGGESYVELYTRVVNYWNELINKGYDKIAVVVHGGVIRSILSHVLEMPLKSAFKFKLDFGGVTKVVINNNLQSVEYINK
jgi:alpha-ribazole phosphatase